VPLDFTFVLWVGSLLLSAAAVVVFLLLMREGANDEGRMANGEAAEKRDSSNPSRPES
jgi:hypothetical protein